MVKRKQTGRKGGPVTKQKKAIILNDIKHLIMTGRNTYTQEELGENYKVSTETISKYIKEAYQSIPPDDIEEVFIDIKGIYNRMRTRLIKILFEFETGLRQDLKEEMKVLSQMRDLIKDFTKLLEDFHKKSKAADNINLNADITQKQISVNINMVGNDGKTAEN